jgi:transcriptional regulator with XRE-family HTH domain
MAGLRPIEMEQFYRRLRERGLTVDDLAAAVGRDRTTVTRVLNGSRRRGPLWKKLERILMPSEVELLDVALRSSWNNRRVERRPVWTPEKAARLTAVDTLSHP